MSEKDQPRLLLDDFDNYFILVYTRPEKIDMSRFNKCPICLVRHGQYLYECIKPSEEYL